MKDITNINKLAKWIAENRGAELSNIHTEDFDMKDMNATEYRYKQEVFKFIKWIAENRRTIPRLGDICAEDVEQYIKHLDKKGFNPETIKMTLTALKHFKAGADAVEEEIQV